MALRVAREVIDGYDVGMGELRQHGGLIDKAPLLLLVGVDVREDDFHRYGARQLAVLRFENAAHAAARDLVSEDMRHERVGVRAAGSGRAGTERRFQTTDP